MLDKKTIMMALVAIAVVGLVFRVPAIKKIVVG